MAGATLAAGLTVYTGLSVFGAVAAMEIPRLLLFDLRGRGESTGRGRSLCYIERDLGGAIDYVKTRGYEAGRIALLGFCSGAASACILGSEEELGALVLDGCFGSVRSMVFQQAAERHIPRFLVSFFLPGVLQAGHIIYKYEPVNPLGVVSEVDCPVLFIHEQYDELIPVQDNQQLYIAATNPESEMWDIGGARHSEGYRATPAAYVERVSAFLQEHLAP